MGLLLYSMYICISACIDWLLCILIDCIFSGANHCWEKCTSELLQVHIILISYINFSNKVNKMANSYHKSKLSTYKQSPSSNLVSYTSMDYKSLPSSNSNSHMDHSKMSRYSNDISMHSYMDQSTHSSKSSNNTTMHSHMNYSNNSPNRSNNISMHSHMSYYSPNSINRSNSTPLQHSHMDYSTNYSANMSNNLSMHSHMDHSSLSARSNNGYTNDYTKYVSDLSICQQNSIMPLTSTWKGF